MNKLSTQPPFWNATLWQGLEKAGSGGEGRVSWPPLKIMEQSCTISWGVVKSNVSCYRIKLDFWPLLKKMVSERLPFGAFRLPAESHAETYGFKYHFQTTSMPLMTIYAVMVAWCMRAIVRKKHRLMQVHECNTVIVAKIENKPVRSEKPILMLLLYC